MNDPTTADALEQALLDGIAALDAPGDDGGDPTGLTSLRALFQAQCLSRHCDLVARRLRADGRGYYTIGSAGHESNAAVALATRPTDPALLHYRSGAFYIARSQGSAASTDPVDDILTGMLALTDEPIAGGRHKVFGHPDTGVIPQTSTIASHLPRAMGVAFAIGRSAKVDEPLWWPPDAIAVCSFGDASANHSTALGAINAACHLAYQGLPVPLLLVCEDNGIGISVRTPKGWIEASYANRPGLRYVAADGDDPVALLAACRDLVDWIRRFRRPAFLHLRTVRFLAHAGTDVELGYRSSEEIRAGFGRDPLLGTARALVAGGMTPDDVIGEYRRLGSYVSSRAGVHTRRGRELATADEVMAPLAPRPEPPVASAPPEPIPAEKVEGGSTLAQAINSALGDLLQAEPGALLFGEDVAVKGGVYGVTKGLRGRFGAARVFDSILDEQSILGVALGTAVSGLLPVAEIQYLAYLHNAEDQLRGEAASLQFFSQGAYRNGMIVRIAAYGYQKGFGGHFHNDDSIAVLRDMPGIVIASPSRPADAAAMLHSLAESALVDGTVGVFLEPIALYHTADLHTGGDGAWLEAVGPQSLGEGAEAAPIGSIRSYGPGGADDRGDADVTIVTWGNGLWMSLRVAARLAAEGSGSEGGPPVRCHVVDLRWLAPLPTDAVLATHPKRVLVVDETRRTGGVSEGVLAGLVDRGYAGPMARVASKDSFIPLGDAARLVLVSETEIAEAVRSLAARPLPAAG